MTDNELQIWIGEAFEQHLAERAWSSDCQCSRKIHGVPVWIEIWTEEQGVVVELSEGPMGGAWKEGRRVALTGQRSATLEMELVWAAQLGFVKALRDLESNAAFIAQREATALAAMLSVAQPGLRNRL